MVDILKKVDNTIDIANKIIKGYGFAIFVPKPKIFEKTFDIFRSNKSSGFVIEVIKGTTEFGKELDSLTDFVSFGIAPAFVIYFWDLNRLGKIGWVITLIFSVCCVLRLARFNLTKYNSTETWKLNYFEGVPSPIGAILILSPLVVQLSDFNIYFEVLL